MRYHQVKMSVHTVVPEGKERERKMQKAFLKN